MNNTQLCFCEKNIKMPYHDEVHFAMYSYLNPTVSLQDQHAGTVRTNETSNQTAMDFG